MKYIAFTLVYLFENCALVTARLIALLDHLNSPFHVVKLVLKTLEIRTGVHSLFLLKLALIIIKL